MSPRKRLAIVDDSESEEEADLSAPSTSRPRLGRLKRAADAQHAAREDSEVVDLSGDRHTAAAPAAAASQPVVLPTPLRRRPVARLPLDSPQAAPSAGQTPPRSTSRAGRANSAAAARVSALKLLQQGQNPLLRLDGASVLAGVQGCSSAMPEVDAGEEGGRCAPLASALQHF